MKKGEEVVPKESPIIHKEDPSHEKEALAKLQTANELPGNLPAS